MITEEQAKQWAKENGPYLLEEEKFAKALADFANECLGKEREKFGKAFIDEFYKANPFVSEHKKRVLLDSTLIKLTNYSEEEIDHEHPK